MMNQADTSGIKIHLSFEVYFDFMELDSATVEREKALDKAPAKDTKEALSIAKQKRDNWQAWLQFVFDNKVVRTWDITDGDGNPLDPRKLEDYRKLSMFDFQRIRIAIALHNKGIVDTAKN